MQRAQLGAAAVVPDAFSRPGPGPAGARIHGAPSGGQGAGGGGGGRRGAHPPRLLFRGEGDVRDLRGQARELRRRRQRGQGLPPAGAGAAEGPAVVRKLPRGQPRRRRPLRPLLLLGPPLLSLTLLSGWIGRGFTGRRDI